MYWLGVDLGTTFTAAATFCDGRADMVSLGNRAPSIPSLVFLRPDDDVIMVGDGAERRGTAEPNRLAREFKRRIGDTTPILLGRTPYSAERLMALLLRHVIEHVTEREGAPPTAVALAHPANWSTYKTDLLRHAAEHAGIVAPSIISEPIAAAIDHAATERVAVGELVAVYDLGGGTFDAAVLQKTADGFEVVGTPQGIERLGGIDIDAAVLAHVTDVIGDQLDGLDRRDPAVLSGLARLQAECTLAKEALSADSETSIIVSLPGIQTEVRLTRVELEGMIRPVLRETIQALRRAIESVPRSAGSVNAVLLVGGSSRIPIVAELVAAEVGAPVRLDTHPKHAVALGAARHAARAAQVTDSTPATPQAVANPPATAPTSRASVAPSTAAAPGDTSSIAQPPAAIHGPAAAPATSNEIAPPTTDLPANGADRVRRSTPTRNPRRSAPAIAAAVTIGLLVVGAAAWALREQGGRAASDVDVTESTPANELVTAATDTATEGSEQEDTAPAATAATVTEAPITEAPVTTPPAPACSSASGLCVILDGIELDGDRYVVPYSTVGYDPIIFEDGVKGTPDDHHVHFFFDTVAPENAGMNGNPPGSWQIWDRDSGGGALIFNGFTVDQIDDFDDTPATRLCGAVATSNHSVLADTASCVALP